MAEGALPLILATSPIAKNSLDIKSTLTRIMGAPQPTKEVRLMELSELIACTLSDTDLKSQQERWIALGENFGLGRQETKDGLRLSFRSHPAIRKELEALVAVERECCTWAAWSVDDAGDALVMAARSQGTGVTTLHGMFMQLA
ncbi:MAG TPA: hypothetical protein VGP54_06665 [Gaiellaceae bacterium]|jgi:hypothetical protein|nr:hypothetical protein [Gaiellaceae bacterium]